MTASVKPVDAWAVVDRHGVTAPNTNSDSRNGAREMFIERYLTSGASWRTAQRLGYRCVRVTVAVKEGGK